MSRMYGFVFVLLAIGNYVFGSVHACGMVTHNTIGKKALRFWEERFEGFEEMIERNMDAYQPGTPAPDWGYPVPSEQCSWCANAAEDFHWPPFYRVAADYIRTSFPLNRSLWDAETEKFVTFIYGGWAHSVGDLTWHALNGQREGLINVMAGQEQASWNDAHGIADTGGEFLASQEFDCFFILPQWYVPTQHMIQLYAQYGYPDVTEELYVRWNRLLFIGAQAVKLGAWVLYPWVAKNSNFLPERYLDYFAGGVDDLGVWTSWCYDDLTAWIATGDTSNLCLLQAVSYANKIHAHSGLTSTPTPSRQQDTIEFVRMAELVDELNLLDVQTIRTEKGVYFRLNPDHNYTSDNFQLPIEVFKNSFSLSILKDMKNAVSSEKFHDLEEEKATCITPNQADFSLSITTDKEEAYLGTSLLVNDINNDGIDDLIIGAPGYSTPGHPQIGAVYILLGRRDINFTDGFHENLDLSNDADAIWIGDVDFGRFGYAISVCDLNRDGWKDLAISSPTDGSRELLYHGRVDVHFGQGGNQLPSFEAGISILGPDRSANHGTTLANGDVDRDGYDDLIIGSMYASDNWSEGVTQVGMVSIHLSFSPNPSLPSYVLFGESAYGWFGQSISFYSPYLFISAPSFSPTGNHASHGYGKVYAYDIRTFVNGSTPSTVFTVASNELLAQFGFDLSVGAPYGDGELCLAISSPNEDEDENGLFNVGVVRVIPISNIYNSPNFPTFTNPSQLPSTSTFYGDRQFQKLGSRLSFVNDGTGRGDDLIISEIFRNRNAGVVYTLRSGSTFPIGVSRGSVPAYSSICYNGPSNFGRFGSIVALGDINGDGTLEQIVASYRSYDDARAPLGGAIYILPHIPQ